GIDADAEPVQLVFHNDRLTPFGFVVELLSGVFGKTEREAVKFASRIDEQGNFACGPYPRSVASAMLEEALKRVRAAGHPLRITSEIVAEAEAKDEAFEYACDALGWHFSDISPSQLVTRIREFPGHMRADVQIAVDRLFASPVGFFGIHEEYRYETTSFAQLI